MSAHKKSKHWKAFQSDSKAKEKTKLALLCLGLIVLIIIVGQTYRFFVNLNSPKTANLAAAKTYQWNDQYPLNLIVKSEEEEISLLSYNPKEQLVNVVAIPEEVYQENQNPTQLKSSITSLLGLPIEGYLEVGGELGEKPAGELIETLRENPFEGLSFYLSSKTDLTPAELIKLTLAITKVRFDKIQTSELASLGFEERQLADGSSVLGVSSSKIDSFVEQKLIDTTLRNEQATVAIFNATKTPGLASKVARIITNMGGNVIFSSNADKSDLQKSYITSNMDAPAYSLQRFQEIFSPNCSDSLRCDILEDNSITASRAQINIIIGEDSINKY